MFGVISGICAVVGIGFLVAGKYGFAFMFLLGAGLNGLVEILN